MSNKMLAEQKGQAPKEFFGLKGKDTITGFEGTISGHCSFITGCDQFSIVANCEGNKKAESGWFDENRIELIDTPADEVPRIAKTEKPGAMTPPTSN